MSIKRLKNGLENNFFEKETPQYKSIFLTKILAKSDFILRGPFWETTNEFIYEFNELYELPCSRNNS
jgi:hypothetical protein